MDSCLKVGVKCLNRELTRPAPGPRLIPDLEPFVLFPASKDGAELHMPLRGQFVGMPKDASFFFAGAGTPISLGIPLLQIPRLPHGFFSYQFLRVSFPLPPLLPLFPLPRLPRFVFVLDAFPFSLCLFFYEDSGYCKEGGLGKR